MHAHKKLHHAPEKLFTSILHAYNLQLRITISSFIYYNLIYGEKEQICT